MKISLRGIRADRNLTQKEVARKMNVSRRTLINWEKNITAPKVGQLMELCRIYEVDISDINLPDKLAKSE